MKLQRYCQRQQHRGMKMLRIWVPDVSHPDFVSEAKRQGELLKARSEELEALNFIEAASKWREP